jgi:hypothetical protein
VLGVLKWTTIEQSLVGPRPSDGWIKIGPGGVLLVKHEKFQLLINLFPQKMVGERGGGGGGGGGGGELKKFQDVHTILQ